MHKLTLEVSTWQELKVIADRLNRDDRHYCHTGKIQLLRDIRELCVKAVDNNCIPPLIEFKNLVDKHIS